jgi:hypothetical protein
MTFYKREKCGNSKKVQGVCRKGRYKGCMKDF